MEGFSEPLAPRTHALLRRAVVEHARGEERRLHPPVLHVGTPGGHEALLEVDPDVDHGLGVDVVAALRAQAHAIGGDDELVWLTRTGGLELQDVDALWLRAARAAYAEAGAALSFVVVNRRGWRDPRSGLGRTWARIRPPSR